MRPLLLFVPEPRRQLYHYLYHISPMYLEHCSFPHLAWVIYQLYASLSKVAKL